MSDSPTGDRRDGSGDVPGDDGRQLLAGLTVVEVGGEPAARAGRILADLGASVTRLVGPVDPLDVPDHERLHVTDDGRDLRRLVWNAGKQVVTVGADDHAEVLGHLAAADIVLATPSWPGTLPRDRSWAPDAVWVDATPFGLDGPRGGWRADDLGVMAASGNLWATGDPDRPPVRCAEPVAWCHAGPEIAFAALCGLAGGRRPCHIDLALAEVVLVANMGAVGRYARERSRGRRRGANIGRTREIWPCADGWVSFGIRGGRARQASWTTMSGLLEAEGLATPAFTGRDWSSFNHSTATDEELADLAGPIGEWFARHTMAELYEIACETNLMLAPASSPREIYASAQLAARGFFGERDGVDGFPVRFARIRVREPGATAPPRRSPAPAHDGPPWTGTRIVELGSGAAGPIATRYFAEHGATVVRIESRTRPDFLRTYALGPANAHGLEGSGMFDALNVAKRSVTLNLKHPDGVAIARRLLLEWSDATSENFAPKAMAGFGLDYATLAAERPDLVMASCCLNGQTGPHKDYPGFGGQGAALSGFNHLTGWPDREPVGPFGTITDSLAPRYVAAALAAALVHRRRTGRGAHIDISQVECALWSLSPWLVDYAVTGRVGGRIGAPGVERVPGTDDDADRWRVRALDADGTPDDDRWIEVADFGDCHDADWLAHRGHLVRLDHPALGPGDYERNGYRVDGAPAAYDRAAPLLGQDTTWVLGELLGLSGTEQARLRDDGALD